MAYCLYLRKSRADIEAESRGEGETLARHERALLELAKRLKLNITEIYREIVSGETISARPVMQHLLSEVEQGIWQGVLVMEVERLARGDTVDQGIVAQTFKYSNTKIITPMKTYDPNNEYDEEYFEFGLFMSRREYKTINRRLQRGRITSVQEGKFLGTTPPYGYKRKKLDKQKGYTLEIEPEQANVVKMIFELCAKGEQQPDGTCKRLGASLISRKLNEMRIKPVKGDVWVPSSILNILQNPVYIGKIRWNFRPAVKKMIDGQMKRKRPRAKAEDWILVDGLHEPIVDIETWEIAQSYLTSNNSRPVPRNKKVKNPLSGLIICGTCGRRMIRRPNSNYPDIIMCPSSACSNISSMLKYVEEKLLHDLSVWLDNYKLDWSLGNNNRKARPDSQLEVKKKSIKTVELEIQGLEKQMSNIHDLLEQGVYSTETFLERSRIINEKITAAVEDKKRLSDDIKIEESKEKSQKVIIPMIEKTLHLYKITNDPALKK